jgi:hypothetical protein
MRPGSQNEVHPILRHRLPAGGSVLRATRAPVESQHGRGKCLGWASPSGAPTRGLAHEALDFTVPRRCDGSDDPHGTPLKRFARSGDMLVAHHGTGCSDEETRRAGGYDGCVERARRRGGDLRKGVAGRVGRLTAAPGGKRMTGMLGGSLLPDTPRCFRCAPRRGESWVLLHERWERSTATTSCQHRQGLLVAWWRTRRTSPTCRGVRAGAAGVPIRRR